MWFFNIQNMTFPFAVVAWKYVTKRNDGLVFFTKVHDTAKKNILELQELFLSQKNVHKMAVYAMAGELREDMPIYAGHRAMYRIAATLKRMACRFVL